MDEFLADPDGTIDEYVQNRNRLAHSTFLAQPLVGTAAGFSPSGAGLDIFTAVTGQDAITGAEVSGLDRAFAVGGVAVSTAVIAAPAISTVRSLNVPKIATNPPAVSRPTPSTTPTTTPRTTRIRDFAQRTLDQIPRLEVAPDFSPTINSGPGIPRVRVTRGADASNGVSADAMPPTSQAWAAARVAELQAQLPTGSQGRVTMGVGVLEDASGNQIRVISTSEPNGYLRPGLTTKPGEIVIPGTGHAEVDIIDYAQANGLRVVTVGAGRPICGPCASAIGNSGGSPATPLKGAR